jgi:hypothetical protein
MPPIACPICNAPMVRFLSKVGGQAKSLFCKEHGYLDLEYVTACDRSAHLQAVMFSLTVMRIHPLMPGDGELINILFDEADRTYDAGRRAWQVTNLEKYAHIKCVRTAYRAFNMQDPLW